MNTAGLFLSKDFPVGADDALSDGELTFDINAALGSEQPVRRQAWQQVYQFP